MRVKVKLETVLVQPTDHHTLIFVPVAKSESDPDHENNTFAAEVPSGKVTLVIADGGELDTLKADGEYYLDISAA